MWIDFGEESSLYQGESLTVMTTKRKCVRDMMLPYWPYLTWKFYLLYGSISSKLIFLKQPSWPKNRELAWAPFLVNVFIILEQESYGTLVKSCLLLHVLLYFRWKIKFSHSIWSTGYFDFSFWFSSAISFSSAILSEMKSLFFQPVYQPPRH